MRRKQFSPRFIAAVIATMTIMNTVAPTVAYAADNDVNMVQTESQQDASQDSNSNQQDASQDSSSNQQDASQDSSSNQQDASQDSSSNQQDASQSSNSNQQDASQNSNNNQQAPSQNSNNNQQAPSQNNNNNQPAPGQNNQSTIFDDAVNITDQDKDNIKNEMDGEDKDLLSWLKNRDAQTKQEAMEAAQKAAKEASQKKIEENVKKAGEIAGKLLVKISKTNYRSKDEMADDIAKTTLELMNDTFIKDAPFVGGLLNAVVKGALEENKDDPTIQQLKKNEEKLQSIYTAINDCALKILDKHDAEMLHQKLVDINNAAKLLDDTYKNNNKSFMRSIEEQARTDENKSIGGPQKVFERIYKTNDDGKDETTYYKNYMDFTDKILNDKNLMDGYDSFGDNSDIFALFKQIVTNGKTDIVEFQAQRKNLTNKLEAYLNNGYDVIKFTMRYDLTKQMNYQAAAEAKLAQLNALLKYADEDKKAELEDQKKEYEDLCFAISDNIGRTEDRLEELEERQAALTKRIDNYKQEMEDDQTRFDNFKPVQEVTQDYLTFKAQMINDRMVYPSISEQDPNTIEYHDIYGHLVRSQYISKEYNKVDQYDVKVGNIYKANWTEVTPYILWMKQTPKEAMIKVTKVYEDGRLGGLYTIRTIEAIDLKTNKTITLQLGSLSTQKAILSEKSVTALVKADK